MANTITSNGSVTFNISGMNVIGNASLVLYTTGSNLQANVVNIATGTWQTLATSSLSDIRFMYFQNDGSGSCQIAVDSGGTEVIAILQDGDFAIIPWSGSLGLWAQAFTSSSILTTIFAES